MTTETQLPSVIDYPEFVLELATIYAFYQQVPPVYHLFNPLCKACLDNRLPDSSHEDYCYNQIPFWSENCD